MLRPANDLQREISPTGIHQQGDESCITLSRSCFENEMIALKRQDPISIPMMIFVATKGQ